MPDQETNTTDGNSVQPEPKFQEGSSAPSGNTVPNFSDQISEDLVNKLAERLLGNEQFQRTLQSTKDKRFSKLNSGLEEVKSKVAGFDIESAKYFQKLVDAGRTPEQAYDAMKLETVYNQLNGDNAGNVEVPAPMKSPANGKAVPEWTVAQNVLLKAFGVDSNDPRVRDFVASKQFADSNQYLKELTAFLPTVSATGAPFQPGANSGIDTNQTAGQEAILYKQYVDGLNKIGRGAAYVREQHAYYIEFKKANKFDPHEYAHKNGLD